MQSSAVAASSSWMPPSGFMDTPTALPVLALACCVPTLIGFWKSEYTVSFGYAGAMAASGLVALAAGGMPEIAVLHATGVALYGIRLGAFLLWRQLSIPRFRDFVARIESRAPPNRLRRFPFVFGCSALYLGLAAPVVLTARYAVPGVASAEALLSVKVALVAMLIGGLVEAVGDLQKSYYKAREPTKYVSGGLFSLLRHPNYTGEQLLWLGSFCAGLSVSAPHLSAAWPWLAGSLLGLLGIQFVLVMATTRLEARSLETYGQAEGYQDYLKKTWGGITMPAKKPAQP